MSDGLQQITTTPAPLWGRLLGPWLAWALRVALGVIFIVAAAPKIVHPDQFAWSIAHYRLVPHALINLMAICLPWIELLCGVALVLGVAIRPNLLIMLALLAIFIGAIGSAMHRDLDISCGCFSPGPQARSMTHATLYWDIIWFVMGLYALIFDRGLLSLSSRLKRSQQ